MNTIEQLVEALKELCEIVEDAIAQKSAKDLDSFTLQPAIAAIAAGEAELKREPVGFLFQHSETGRTRVVMKDDVMDADASWFKVGPLYLGEEIKTQLQKCLAALEHLTAERNAWQVAYGRADEVCDGLLIENAQLKKDYTRVKESATLWNERYQTKCQEYMDRQAALGAEIVALEAERGREAVCLWNNVDGCWETTCGNAFEINDGTPSENNMAYCCYCGGKVEEDIK